MRRQCTTIAAAFLITCAVEEPIQAQNTVRALSHAESVYRGIETIRASFTQTLENPMLGGAVVSSGTMLLAPPSRFAMWFTDPEGDQIVCDGTWLWIYLPSSVPGQVLRRPIPRRGAATPNLLAQFVDRPLEHYRASHVGSDTIANEIVDVVSLIPRRSDDPFKEAEVSIARATGLVRRLMVVEPAGQRRTIVFEQVEQNVPIPDDELEFVVPSGARVITP